MILRDYQEEIKGRVYAAWDAGCRSVMCQMPTGTGKTVVMSQIIAKNLRSEELKVKSEKSACAMRVLVVAHRVEILWQICDTLQRYGLGEYIDKQIRIESIQKLARKADLKSLGLMAAPSLIVIDEAHHCTAKSYRKLWKWWPEAKFVGLTATPCRMKAEGFDELFDKLICSNDVSWFIGNGWLSLYNYYAVKPNSDMLYNVRCLRERGVDGDYLVSEMGSLMDNRASIEQLYMAYKDYADGKQGIIYAINREHAAHIADYYSEKGESAVVVDSETAKATRKQIDEDYRAGKIKILVNCEIYGEGYDAPFVEFIQLARPTLSLSKYLQQVGRGLRPYEGKEYTIILDCVGHCYLFGLPNEKRDWEDMFHNGQIADNYGRFPKMDSKDFRYLCMQPRDIIDIDDGHDHEMQQVLSVRDLKRELEKTKSNSIVASSTQLGNSGNTRIAGLTDEQMQMLLSKENIDKVLKVVDDCVLVSKTFKADIGYGSWDKQFLVDLQGGLVFDKCNVKRLNDKGIAIIEDTFYHGFYDIKTRKLYHGTFNSIYKRGRIEFIQYQSDGYYKETIPRLKTYCTTYISNIEDCYGYGQCYVDNINEHSICIYHQSIPDMILYVLGWYSLGEGYVVYDAKSKDYLLWKGSRLSMLKRKKDAQWNGYYTEHFCNHYSGERQERQLVAEMRTLLQKHKTLTIDS